METRKDETFNALSEVPSIDRDKEATSRSQNETTQGEVPTELRRAVSCNPSPIRFCGACHCGGFAH